MVFAPKVSIVIPVFNGANYLREAIDSALAQTYTNIEVIVINDGSDDAGKSEEIAVSYGDAIRYLRKENGGVASALNAGIRAARGDYISWLSHDDLYSPQKIERQIALLASMPSREAILYSDYEMIYEEDKSLEMVRLTAPELTDSRHIILSHLFTSQVHGCSLLLPKKCFAETGYFNENLRTTQDYDLWFRLLSYGYVFLHQPEILITSRIHSEQGTHALLDLNYREAEQLFVGAVNQFHEDIVGMPVKTVVDLLLDMRRRRLKKASHYLLRMVKFSNGSLYRQMYTQYGKELIVSRLKMQVARPLQLISGVISLIRTRRKVFFRTASR